MSINKTYAVFGLGRYGIAVAKKLAGSGAFTINDILKAANREPINEPWADQHYLTKNIGALQEMLNPVDS